MIKKILGIKPRKEKLEEILESLGIDMSTDADFDYQIISENEITITPSNDPDDTHAKLELVKSSNIDYHETPGYTSKVQIDQTPCYNLEISVYKVGFLEKANEIGEKYRSFFLDSKAFILDEYSLEEE